MTGERFRSLSRHDDRLEELVRRYYELGDKTYDMYQALCRDDVQDWQALQSEYNALKLRKQLLGRDIFARALSNYGDWNIAREYCRRKGIDW